MAKVILIIQDTPDGATVTMEGDHILDLDIVPTPAQLTSLYAYAAALATIKDDLEQSELDDLGILFS